MTEIRPTCGEVHKADTELITKLTLRSKKLAEALKKRLDSDLHICEPKCEYCKALEDE